MKDIIKFAQAYQKLSRTQKQAISLYVQHQNRDMSDFMRAVTLRAIEDLLQPFEDEIMTDLENLPPFIHEVMSALIELDV